MSEGASPQGGRHLRDELPKPRRRLRPRVLWVAGGVLAALVMVGGGLVWATWSRIDRVDFDPEGVRPAVEASGGPQVDASYFEGDAPANLGDVDTSGLDLSDVPNQLPEAIEDFDSVDYSELDLPEPPETTTTTGLPAPPPSPSRGLTGYLLIGTDGSLSAGAADVIYLAVRGGGSPVLFAVPRSLYINNPCTDTPVRVALLLRGCPGTAGGGSLLAAALSEFTGVSIQGYVVIADDGFVDIVNALGGITICSEHPRGQGKQVIIPAGCNLVDGASAAWWVTSRSQDRLVDGEWEAVPGDDELSRSARQSKALQAVISRIASFGSVGSLVSVANQVPHTFALGGVSLSEAASLGYSASRGYSLGSFPVREEVTPDGRYVLYPTEPFSATLSRYGL